MTINIQGQTNTMSCIFIKVQAQKENLHSRNLILSITNIHSSCKDIIKQKKGGSFDKHESQTLCL